MFTRGYPHFFHGTPHFGCLKWSIRIQLIPFWGSEVGRSSGHGWVGWVLVTSGHEKRAFFLNSKKWGDKARSMGIHEEFRRIMKNWGEKSLRFVVLSFRHHFLKHQKRSKISLEIQAVPAFCNLLEAEIKKVPGSDPELTNRRGFHSRSIGPNGDRTGETMMIPGLVNCYSLRTWKWP